MAKQFFAGITNSTATDNLFINPYVFGTWRGTEAQQTAKVRKACKWSKLVVRLSVAPGAGTSYTYTLFKNGVATSLTCTISDLATSGSDLVNSATFAAGDTISIKRTRTGVPASSIQRFSIVCETTSAAGDSIYGHVCDTAGALNASAVRYNGVFTGKNSTWAAVITDLQTFSAIAGNLTSFTVDVDVAPGSTKSLEFAIWKNGTKQDGSGGTVDTRATIADLATTVTGTFTLPVAIGDRLVIGCTPTNTPTVSRVNTCFGFNGTIANRANLCIIVQTTYTTLNPSYNQGIGYTNTTNTTEANELLPAPYGFRFIIDALYVNVETAPGVTNRSYTYNPRLNSATPGGTPSVTISNTATSGSDLTGQMTIPGNSVSDSISFREAPSGSPTAPAHTWISMALLVRQGGVGAGVGDRGNKAGGGVVILSPGGPILLCYNPNVDGFSS